MLFTNSEMISQDVKLKFTFLKHQLKTLPNSLVASRAQLQDRNVQNSTLAFRLTKELWKCGLPLPRKGLSLLL